MQVFYYKKLLFFAVIILFTEILNYAQDQESYAIRNFTKQEYKAESQNWSITKDQHGYIYVANNIGLLEFDGIEWNFHPAPNGTIIRSVAIDKNNRVFTSGYREIGFWERDNYGNLNYQSLNSIAEPLFSQNEEFWTTVIVNEKVYFHSFSSLFIYDYESFSVIRPDGMINSVSEINGQLCINISQKGLFILEDSLLTPFLTHPKIKNKLVRFVAPLRDSSLIIGTDSDGLFQFKEKQLLPYLENWKHYFSENKINRGAVANNGNIILGTLLDGIVIFDQQENVLHQINNENGLQNNTVLGINSLDDNNIWLSLDQGIDFLTFHEDPSYSYSQHDEVGAVYSATLFEEDLYLGTNQGAFYRNWKDDNQDFNIISGTQGQVWNCDVFDNNLIVGHNAGSFYIREKVAERISDIAGGFRLIKNPIKNESLIQSSYSNIVFYEKIAGIWQYKYQLPGFNDLIRYIEMDQNNNLWASHMHRGIYRIQLNDLQDSILNLSYIGDSIFGQDYDIQVFKIENRIVFTTGKQIFTYNDLDNSIIPFDNLNQNLGKYSESHRIIAGPNHHYWFISKNGIALFKIFNSNFQKIKEYPVELFKDHLIFGFENIFPLDAESGILCLDNGFAILRANQADLSDLIQDKYLSLNKIENRSSSGKNERMSITRDTIEIPYTKNSLSLSFAFPLFSSETIEFQYYIEGLDKEWSKPLPKPIFNMSRIPSGEYIIYVRAFNKWGKESIHKQIRLKVSPPWYLKEITFYSYGLIFLSLLLISRHILVQRIRSREKKIRDTKEKELISLRNEKLNAELSFKSQELANSTMSFIKKNEFLLNLKETIKRQKEDLGTRYPEKYSSQLIKKIDNNISSMDDWNIFEVHFEKAHEKFLQKLMNRYPLLSHSDLRLCAYLRMNLSSKEIAPLLRISVRGVENHRYKLRKKLNLKKDENLTDFILAI